MLPKAAAALSVIAILISLSGVNAADAVQSVRRALSAKNADAVDGISASRMPRAGLLFPLGRDGRFPPAVLPPSARGPRGPQGPSGSNGKDGVPGVNGVAGDRGPSDAYVASGQRVTFSAQANVPVTLAKLSSLPAGSYVVEAHTDVVSFAPGSEVGCGIRAAGDAVASSNTTAGASSGYSIISAVGAGGAVNRSAPFDLTWECSANQAIAAPNTPFAETSSLIAIRVGTLRTAP